MIDPKIIKFDSKQHLDDRGSFVEIFKQSLYCTNIMQLNISHSKKGVLRGLHYQIGEHAQGKFIYLVDGQVKDCILNIDPSSEYYGEYYSFDLRKGSVLYVPPYYAHGFYVLKEATFLYGCSNEYNKDSERSYHYTSIPNSVWGIIDNDILVSDKDQNAKKFKRE